MSIKFLTIPQKSLTQSISSSAMAFKISNIKGWAKNNLGINIALTAADFGTQAFGVFRNDTGTIIEIFEFDPTTIAAASVTILKRGLDFNGDISTENTNYKLDWPAGTTIMLGTDAPQLFSFFVKNYGDETIDGIKTFSSSPIVPTPTTATQAANKDYVDYVAIAGAPDASTSTKGISKTSVAPASPTDPIVVGDNDPRVQGVWNYYGKDTWSSSGATKTFSSLPAHTYWKIVWKYNYTAASIINFSFRMNNVSTTNHQYIIRTNSAITSTGGSTSLPICEPQSASANSAYGEFVVDGVHRGGIKKMAVIMSATEIVADYGYFSGYLSGDSNDLSRLDFIVSSTIDAGQVELYYRDSI